MMDRLFAYGRKTNFSSKLIVRKMGFILEYLSMRSMASYGAMVADFNGDIYDPTTLRYAINKLLYEGEIEKCTHPINGSGYYRRTKRNGEKLPKAGHRDVRPAPDNVG